MLEQIVCRADTQGLPHRSLGEEALVEVGDFARISRAMSVSTLTASIAHELCQPLSGIITNATTCLRMLAADSPDIDAVRETARRTLRDGIRASEVVARLRALFAKREANTEPVDLNDAIREVVALSSSTLQLSGVAMSLELADDLPLVAGDRVQLQEVVLNLLLNAADAMNGVCDRPRRLLIRTEFDATDYVRASVEDTGVGLGCYSPDKVFEPFFTTKRVTVVAYG